MPTVLRVRGFKFYFFSEEGLEPPHIHVRKGGGVAKFWLAPVQLAHAEGFKQQELRALVKIVEAHEIELIHAWHETE
jgi:hypothetical protein